MDGEDSGGSLLDTVTQLAQTGGSVYQAVTTGGRADPTQSNTAARQAAASSDQLKTQLTAYLPWIATGVVLFIVVGLISRRR